MLDMEKPRAAGRFARPLTMRIQQVGMSAHVPLTNRLPLRPVPHMSEQVGGLARSLFANPWNPERMAILERTRRRCSGSRPG